MKATFFIRDNGYIYFVAGKSSGIVSTGFRNIGVCSNCRRTCLALVFSAYKSSIGKHYYLCCKCLGDFKNSLNNKIIVCMKCGMEDRFINFVVK